VKRMATELNHGRSVERVHFMAHPTAATICWAMAG
jgi:hypothetical protein